MLVNFYYSLRYEFGEQDQDLLTLCHDCAKKHADQVQWASNGHDQAECEFCGVSNDEANSRELDAVFTQITGSPAPARRQVRHG